MHMRQFTAALLIVLAGAAQANDGLALMRVEPGARPSGMAGTLVSIDGDPLSSAYNPAGGGGVSSFVVSFGYNTYWENIELADGYFVAPLFARWSLHGGIRYAGVNDIEGRTQPTLDPFEITTFDAEDVSFKAGLRYDVSSTVSAGVAAGWYIEKISSYRGSAFNVDLGVLVRATHALTMGAAVTSLGSDFQLEESGQGRSRDISLPTTYRVGGSYRYDRYLGALDVVYVNDDPHVHVGAEADIHEVFTVRAGVMTGYDSRNITAGATIRRRNFSFDYGFVPYSNDFGTSHLFNLTVTL
ncbi:MAG: PorV/PorQ family protein [candidate division Zixibacteria bacterium]|jgi:hypothetical protein|nr:PorV/PorQ family protein [candidate division Zixibacteria bacterium]